MANEWERTTLTGVLLLLLAYFGFIAYNCLVDNESSATTPPRAKTPHEYFDTRSTAYLKPANFDNALNPMQFHIRVSLPEPQSKQQPKQQPSNQPTAKQPQQTAKQPQQPQQPQQPKPQPKPQRKITVSYRGFISYNKDKSTQVAFYSAHDTKGKKTEAKTVKKGFLIHGIIEIKDFDSTTLTLLLGNKEVVVKKGKKQDFIIQ